MMGEGGGVNCDEGDVGGMGVEWNGGGSGQHDSVIIKGTSS